MSTSLTGSRIRGDTAEVMLALVGNPNVGKSTIFNQLTGLGVVTAHYPGKTVDVTMGVTSLAGRDLALLDLPGIYALNGASEEQWVVRRSLTEMAPDVIVSVVDASNLERNLYLVLQLIDLELPVVVALNLMDEAKRAGTRVDAEHLSSLLGVPVVPIQATTGSGIETLMLTALAATRPGQPVPPHPAYGRDVTEHISELTALVDTGPWDPGLGFSTRAIAVLLLENDPETVAQVRASAAAGSLMARRAAIARHLEGEHGEPVETRVARERHGLAGAIASQVRHRRSSGEPLSARLWRWSIAPATGLPTLIVVLGTVFTILFQVGNLLEELVNTFWATFVSPPIGTALTTVFGVGAITNTLKWGFDAGILAILSVGIPYVLVFYLMLAFLEDAGYLSSVAFLLDNVMHRFGLHGRAAIPLLAAAGCNVPAVMGLRTLSSLRERVIASALIVLVPCTARTAVIVGVVGHYAGWQAALGLIVVVTIIAVLAGLGLNKVLPGSSDGMVMEMFPFRIPHPLTVLRKTWYRFHDFVFVALPIVLGGSIGLGFLYETNLIWLASVPLQWIVEGWLGLPVVAGLCLVFAVLRKELAMQLLVAFAVVQYGPQADNLAKFMNPNQLFVYALVNTIYMPCLATLAVLQRESGTRITAALAAGTVVIALAAGGAAIRILGAF